MVVLSVTHALWQDSSTNHSLSSAVLSEIYMNSLNIPVYQCFVTMKMDFCTKITVLLGLLRVTSNVQEAQVILKLETFWNAWIDSNLHINSTLFPNYRRNPDRFRPSKTPPAQAGIRIDLFCHCVIHSCRIFFWDFCLIT